MQYVNLTPHAINVNLADGRTLIFPPSGTVARVDTLTAGFCGHDDSGIPIYEEAGYGPVIDLPMPRPETVYIVSTMVRTLVSDRLDVLSPGTGPKDDAVRNEKGHIVAVTRLIRNPKLR